MLSQLCMRPPSLPRYMKDLRNPIWSSKTGLVNLCCCKEGAGIASPLGSVEQVTGRYLQTSPPMSSEQLNICNLYFSVNALPKGRCLTEHCVVCVLCCGLCVSLGGRSGLCNHNMCTYILLRIYRYIHIYVWQGKLCCFYCSLQIILGIGSVFTISCSHI